MKSVINSIIDLGNDAFLCKAYNSINLKHVGLSKNTKEILLEEIKENSLVSINNPFKHPTYNVQVECTGKAAEFDDYYPEGSFYRVSHRISGNSMLEDKHVYISATEHYHKDGRFISFQGHCTMKEDNNIIQFTRKNHE